MFWFGLVAHVGEFLSKEGGEFFVGVVEELGVFVLEPDAEFVGFVENLLAGDFHILHLFVFDELTDIDVDRARALLDASTVTRLERSAREIVTAAGLALTRRVT